MRVSMGAETLCGAMKSRQCRLPRRGKKKLAPPCASAVFRRQNGNTGSGQAARKRRLPQRLPATERNISAKATSDHCGSERPRIGG
jgi:hypothetical protein